MKYSIVIPTYNHCDDLLKPCIESIIKYSDLEQLEIIVIANGCKDETVSYLKYLDGYFDSRNLSNNFKWQEYKEPLGYSKATNAGIKLATAPKIVLLNNDVIILDQQKHTWIDVLNLPFITHPKCGISCVLKQRSEPAGWDFAVFFCVMIKKEVFDAIGLLNEEYGVGAGEDTEFCIEAEKAGFEVRECVEKIWNGNTYTGNYPIYHKGEGTVHDTALVSNWNEIFFNNSLKLAKKYNPDHYRWLLCNHFERAVFLKGDDIFPRYKYEHVRYSWAAQNLLGKKVLEIGCSTGYGTQYLPRDIEYTGLDYDKTIINCAKEQDWGHNYKFVNCDINKFDLDQYDTIIAFEVIEHIANGLEVVERLKKHCKRLLITVPRKEPPGFWGPHHLLHNLHEGMFPGFKFKYITDEGLQDTPNDNAVSLMVCRWDNE